MARGRIKYMREIAPRHPLQLFLRIHAGDILKVKSELSKAMQRRSSPITKDSIMKV